jgi:hypothetical protein
MRNPSVVRVPLLLLLLVLSVITSSVVAANAPAQHRLMFFEYGSSPNRFVELDVNGKIVWTFKPRSLAVIFQLLPNGNVVYGYGGKPTGVVEVNRKGETVWNYVSKCPQVIGCERLPDGNTLVAEQGPCQAVEVDPHGQVVRTTKLLTKLKEYHLQVRNVHKLANGNLLASHEGEGAVREYDIDGNVVWEHKGMENTFDALRLDNGNTLIAGGTQKRVVEVSPDGEVVWEFKADDAPLLNLTWVGSLQVLSNGNYLVGNFLRGQEGKGAHAFEVTREKEVVWTFTDHKQFRAITTIRAVDDPSNRLAAYPVNHPIMVNDDGHGGFYSGRYTSAQDLHDKILTYRDTHVTVLQWCISLGGRVNYPSRVTEILGTGVKEYPRRGDQQASETLQKLAAEGTDVLAVAAAACHEAGIKCYASIRMNFDFVPGYMGEIFIRTFNSTFWWENPHLRIRDSKGEDLGKLSYAFPEVQDFKLAIVREVLERDIDGIDLDFLRNPDYLGFEKPMVDGFQATYGEDPRTLNPTDPRWLDYKGEVMTAYVQKVRKAVNEAAKKKGRRLLICTRVDHEKYREWGLDIATWMGQGLIDQLVVAQHSLGGYTFDLKPFVEMAKGTNCEVFFGEEANVSGHDLTPEQDKAVAEGKMKEPERGRLSAQRYYDRARQWYTQGARGIHVHNDDGNLPVLRVLGDPARFPASQK